MRLLRRQRVKKLIKYHLHMGDFYFSEMGACSTLLSIEIKQGGVDKSRYDEYRNDFMQFSNMHKWEMRFVRRLEKLLNK